MDARGSSAARLRVLLVDDEELNLRVEARYLGQEPGIEVIVEPDVEQAIERLKQGSELAAIVSNQSMPKMSGVELLGLCQALCPKASRVLLTGFSEIPEVVEARRSGLVCSIVSKPCSQQALVEAVRHALALFRAAEG